MTPRRAILLRTAIGLAALVLALGVGAGCLWAAGGDWPPFNPDPAPNTNFRGPGFYLNWIEILACWLVFLAWVATTNWVSIDGQDLKLDYLRWNAIVFGVFFAAFILVWIIPVFWIAFPLLVLAYVVPLTTYILHRNSKVDNNQRVMTSEHIRYLFATCVNRLGGNMAIEKVDPHESGPPVKVFARGGPDERVDNARLLMARQSPGLTAAREILADGLTCRASSIMLDYTQQGVAMRTMIDGVWIPREGRPRETADPALDALKLLCGLNPQDRQSRQMGAFGIEYESAKIPASFVSQGTPTGERVLIQFEEKRVRFQDLDELGMRPKLQEEFRQSLDAQKGFVLLSGVPAGGLRTTTDVVLRSCDRFTREFGGVEDESNRYLEVENIATTTYKSVEGQTPADVLTKFFRTEPQVAVVRDLVNAKTVGMMCDEIVENRLMISTIRAKDCVDALLRVLALGVPPDQFAEAITAVLSQRLIRKLCESCKEAYAPPPQVLQQLGIPEGRVQAFYRPRQPNPDDPKELCQACGGIGYFGRTAIFELLTVGPTLRKVLASDPQPELLRKAARKDGMKSLQEEGVLLVARGVTSLPELMRVMKQ